MTATADISVSLTFCGLVVGRRREDLTAWEPCRETRYGIGPEMVYHVSCTGER